MKFHFAFESGLPDNQMFPQFSGYQTSTKRIPGIWCQEMRSGCRIRILAGFEVRARRGADNARATYITFSRVPYDVLNEFPRSSLTIFSAWIRWNLVDRYFVETVSNL